MSRFLPQPWRKAALGLSTVVALVLVALSLPAAQQAGVPRPRARRRA